MQAEMHVAETGRARLAYFDLAPARNERGTVLLLHGFASNAKVNWLNTGWTDVLRDAGYRVIAVDQRGHGASEKFYDAADYGPDIFAEDAHALLDNLGLERVHVLGFSMGARVTAWFASHHGDRVGRAVLGGMGDHIFGGRGNHDAIIHALTTDAPDEIEQPAAKSFRTFADRTGSDRHALAACISPSAARLTPAMIEAIDCPVLVVVGDRDEIAGRAEPLVAMMKQGRAVTLPGLDHMRSTGATGFKEAVVGFLNE